MPNCWAIALPTANISCANLDSCLNDWEKEDYHPFDVFQSHNIWFIFICSIWFSWFHDDDDDDDDDDYGAEDEVEDEEAEDDYITSLIFTKHALHAAGSLDDNNRLLITM